MAARMRQFLEAMSRMARLASLRLGSVPSVLFLCAYVLLIFVFSAIYFVLPDRSFFHSTSQYEYDEFNADAERLLSDLEVGIKSNLVNFYKTDELKIRGWALDTRQLEVHSLSVKDFPEEFSFRLVVPLSRLDPNFGRIETQFRWTVTVPLQGRLIIGEIVYLFLKPEALAPPLIEGIPPEPSLQDLFPYTGEVGALPPPVLGLPMNLYAGIVEFGQGYRGFPAGVKGQYLRMLYFSAGLATASALGDIVPVTSTARLLVTIQALLSLAVFGLFLNALAVDIAGPRKRARDDTERT